MQELEFITVVDRTYPWFPSAQDRDSIGIDMPNAYYDRDLGQQVLSEVLQGAQRAERLGYDGILVFEQHNTPLTLIPNALTAAAWLAGQTKGIRIVANGPVLSFYSSPVRLAEEVALVDTISGGRLTLGLPLGIGAAWHGYAVANPVHARPRVDEAMALLNKIWTEDGPFAWEGDYYNIPYVNVWPRPRQDPVPVFVPAAGSRETIELCAKYDFTYQAILVPLPVLQKNLELFRQLRAEHGRPDDPSRIAMVLSVHVAETDAQAREEVEKYALWGTQNIFRYQFHESFPPGHASQGSLRGMMSGGYRSADVSQTTWETMTHGPLGVIAGSAETVRERLAEATGLLGAGRVILNTEYTLPMWLQEKSMTLFAQEVMPHFRAPGALASWQRQPAAAYQTEAELIGRTPRRAGVPEVVMGDQTVPLYPHVPGTR